MVPLCPGKHRRHAQVSGTRAAMPSSAPPGTPRRQPAISHPVRQETRAILPTTPRTLLWVIGEGEHLNFGLSHSAVVGGLARRYPIPLAGESAASPARVASVSVPHWLLRTQVWFCWCTGLSRNHRAVLSRALG
jgi:hypothetical protein